MLVNKGCYAMNTDLQDWISYLQTERSFSVHTIRAYRTDVGDFIRFLQQRKVKNSQVTRNDVLKKLFLNKIES